MLSQHITFPRLTNNKWAVISNHFTPSDSMTMYEEQDFGCVYVSLHEWGLRFVKHSLVLIDLFSGLRTWSLYREESEKQILGGRSSSGMVWSAYIRHRCVPAYALAITPHSDRGEPKCDRYFTAGWCVRPLLCTALTYGAPRCYVFWVCLYWQDMSTISDTMLNFAGSCVESILQISLRYW